MILLLQIFHSLITGPQTESLKIPCTQNCNRNEMLYLFLILKIKKVLLLCIKIITNENNT
jgi:hypothetical protein